MTTAVRQPNNQSTFLVMASSREVIYMGSNGKWKFGPDLFRPALKVTQRPMRWSQNSWDRSLWDLLTGSALAWTASNSVLCCNQPLKVIQGQIRPSPCGGKAISLFYRESTEGTSVCP